MRIVLVLLFLSSNCYCQNVFHLAKTVKRGVKVRRTVVVRPRHAHLAKNVLERHIQKARIQYASNRAVLTADLLQPITRPMDIAGGNNYLKLTEKALKKRGFKIDRSNGYNGAHHIMTKSAIRQIAGNNPEMIANAPSVFHPLHNDPIHIDVFHNHERIVELYTNNGVKAVILDFFYRANELNKQEGIKPYDDNLINTELLEAELWAKHWGLKW